MCEWLHVKMYASSQSVYPRVRVPMSFLQFCGPTLAVATTAVAATGHGKLSSGLLIQVLNHSDFSSVS